MLLMANSSKYSMWLFESIILYNGQISHQMLSNNFCKSLITAQPLIFEFSRYHLFLHATDKLPGKLYTMGSW